MDGTDDEEEIQGDGAHKALFGTDCLPCCSFVLLEPNWSNAVILGSYTAFESAVDTAKRIVTGSRAEKWVRRVLSR